MIHRYLSEGATQYVEDKHERRGDEMKRQRRISIRYSFLHCKSQVINYGHSSSSGTLQIVQTNIVAAEIRSRMQTLFVI